MEHRIEWVEDALLHIAGQQRDWALLNDRTEGVILCIRRSGRSLGDEEAAKVLARALGAYRQLLEECPDLIPSQRGQSSSATASP